MNDTGMEQRLRRGVQTATLADYYGGLLTDKQRTALRLHYEEDWSLGEIADELGVSRQNVHELITRSEEKLARYEALLGCAARESARQQRLLQELEALDAARDALADDQGGNVARDAVACARNLLCTMLSEQEGEDESHGV